LKEAEEFTKENGCICDDEVDDEELFKIVLG
jgi:hypothetical protein